eukprot:3257276-Pleurochrysis_carterae.AAC.1
MHEALSRKKWGKAPRTPRMWEADELVTTERKITTKPITFHRTLAEMGVAEWADIYDVATKEYYTMGSLCKSMGLHSRQLLETEQGALGIIWERHKEALLGEKGEQDHKRKMSEMKEKRKTAECWGERNI